MLLIVVRGQHKQPRSEEEDRAFLNRPFPGKPQAVVRRMLEAWTTTGAGLCRGHTSGGQAEGDHADGSQADRGQGGGGQVGGGQEGEGGEGEAEVRLVDAMNRRSGRQR